MQFIAIFVILLSLTSALLAAPVPAGGRTDGGVNGMTKEETLRAQSRG